MSSPKYKILSNPGLNSKRGKQYENLPLVLACVDCKIDQSLGANPITPPTIVFAMKLIPCLHRRQPKRTFKVSVSILLDGNMILSLLK